MSIPIHDLHCDLLLYLQEDPKRTPFDPIVKCSIPQLLAGPVKRQVMAVFSETNDDSSKNGKIQVNRFLQLRKEFSQINMLLALENASTLCSETEPLDHAFKNLTDFLERCGRIVYVSLTWNTENRFGGGAHTKIGLKEDGKLFLDFLSGKGVAVDLSHTSDALAHDLLNYIDKNLLKIPIIASHSNFRAICDMPRNLPDELVKEIFKRDGVLGVNFVKKFVGPGIVRHIEYGLKLGGENHLCFGADFYYEGDLSPAFRSESPFIPGYDHAGCYQKIISELDLPVRLWHKIAHENFDAFVDSRVLLSRQSV